MYPQQHAIFTTIFAFLLLLIFPQIGFEEFLIIVIAGMVIDVDHYLYYVFKKKDLSLKNAYNWFMEHIRKYKTIPLDKRKECKVIPLFFHGIEFVFVLVILSFFNRIFLFILIGVFFHMILDYVELMQCKKPWYTKFSQIYVAIRNRNRINNID